MQKEEPKSKQEQGILQGYRGQAGTLRCYRASDAPGTHNCLVGTPKLSFNFGTIKKELKQEREHER